jgi:hypothetical protein
LSARIGKIYLPLPSSFSLYGPADPLVLFNKINEDSRSLNIVDKTLECIQKNYSSFSRHKERFNTKTSQQRSY